MAPEETVSVAKRSRLLDHAVSRRAVLRGSAMALGLSALAGLAAACGGGDSPAETPSTAAGSGGADPGTPTTSPAGADGTPKRGGRLVVALPAEPELLDPHRATQMLVWRTLALLHDNLISRDYDGSFAPDLAETWDVSDDGTVYTFTLKTGVSFHSGKPLTAADVKYTFERWLGEERSPTAYLIEPVASVEAPDAQTVVFTLSRPYNVFLDQLAGGWSVIVNQDAIEEAGEDYGLTTVDGTGPFTFVSWARGQQLVLARNEAYTWGAPIFENRGPAYLDEVEYRFIPEDSTLVAEFLAGTFQIVQELPRAQIAQLDVTPGVSVVKYKQHETTYLGFNTTKAPFDDARVRRAIAHALNKEDILTGASFGLGRVALTMLAPETPGYAPEVEALVPEYDPEEAARLLDEAGWTLGSDGIRERDGQKLVLPLWTMDHSSVTLQSQIVEQQLAQVGIKVETTQHDQAGWFAATSSGEQTGIIMSFYYDSSDILYNYFHSEQRPAPNRYMYANPDVDAWLDETRTNPDQAAVAEASANVQKQLLEDMPAVPLIHEQGTLGKADGVEGVRVHPSRWLYRMLDIYYVDA